MLVLIILLPYYSIRSIVLLCQCTDYGTSSVLLNIRVRFVKS